MENLKVINQRENPLFNRKEVQINVEINVAPKTKEAEELVAKHFLSQPENVKIRKIKGRFGSKSFTISANIYNSKEDKDQIEKSKKNKKENKTEEKKE